MNCLSLESIRDIVWAREVLFKLGDMVLAFHVEYMPCMSRRENRSVANTHDCNLSFYSTVLFKRKSGVIQFCIKNNLLVSSLLVIGRYEMLVTRLLLDDAVSSSFSSFRLLLLLYAMSEVMGRLRSRLSFNLLTTYRTDGSVSVLCEKHLVFPPYDFR